MKITDNNKLIENLNWRYATKKFDPSKKISETDWNTLEQALILTPSSYGLQPWKFFVITNQEIKNELMSHSWKQNQVANCSHLVVFTILKKIDEDYIQKFLQLTATTRNTPIESFDGLKKMLISDLISGARAKIITEWATRQGYIALGNFMTSASVLGVDTCPLEGIIPDKYDEVLNIKNSAYQTIVTCAAGYRDSEDKYSKLKKVRFQVNDVITHI